MLILGLVKSGSLCSGLGLAFAFRANQRVGCSFVLSDVGAAASSALEGQRGRAKSVFYALLAARRSRIFRFATGRDDVEYLKLLALGIAIGIAASAPVGAVNVITIQRVIRHGLLAGLSAGAGAVMADAVLATVAALGLTAVDDFIDRNAMWIQLAGGLLVIGFGARILASHPHMQESAAASPMRASSAATAFVMTITNPGAMLGFVAMFGALGDLAPDSGESFRVAQLVMGVVIGGLLWWTALALAVRRLRQRLTGRTLALINNFAGSILIGFGMLILARIAFLRFGLL